MAQKMASLPDFRCTQSPPFTHVGIDFAGPLFVKEKPDGTKTKCWIVLFTCVVTRAIHLALVNSLSTEAFLAALNRFTSRRGMPTNIYCDNAKTFIRAEKELQTLYRSATSATVERDLTTKNIKFVYNPPIASHWGGM